MHLNLVQLDDRVFSLNRAELSAPQRVRQRFERNLRIGWLYHQLNVEGIVATLDDLTRGLRGLDGADYCDAVLLNHVRHFDRLRETQLEAAEDREPLTVELLQRFHETVSGEGGMVLRKREGATQQYKHDVADPALIASTLPALLAEFESRSLVENPVKLAIELHYRLVMLWPFTNYSALIARLAADHLLMRAGYPPMVIQAADRRRYYQAMHYDISRMRELQLEAIETMVELRAEAFGRYIERAARETFAIVA